MKTDYFSRKLKILLTFIVLQDKISEILNHEKTFINNSFFLPASKRICTRKTE